MQLFFSKRDTLRDFFSLQRLMLYVCRPGTISDSRNCLFFNLKQCYPKDLPGRKYIGRGYANILAMLSNPHHLKEEKYLRLHHKWASEQFAWGRIEWRH